MADPGVVEELAERTGSGEGVYVDWVLIEALGVSSHRVPWEAIEAVRPSFFGGKRENRVS